MISSICVCGAGTMGSGIALASAQSGFYTILYELNGPVLQKAAENIRQTLQKLTDKRKITEGEKEVIFNRIQFTTNLHDCLADIIIEAIIEKPEAKTALFNQLAELNHSETIFASNTSSLSVNSLAEMIKNPERVVGMHFFNPATLMKLVEIVKTPYTAIGITEKIKSLCLQMGKIPVVCKDSPGFIVNRVARPYYIESLRMAEEGVSLSQIDSLLENAGFKMGPFRLMDLIGNDVNYAVSCSVYNQLNKPGRLKPSAIQQQLVTQKKLGRKTGEGYYNYNEPAD